MRRFHSAVSDARWQHAKQLALSIGSEIRFPSPRYPSYEASDFYLGGSISHCTHCISWSHNGNVRISPHPAQALRTPFQGDAASIRKMLAVNRVMATLVK